MKLKCENCGHEATGTITVSCNHEEGLSKLSAQAEIIKLAEDVLNRIATIDKTVNYQASYFNAIHSVIDIAEKALAKIRELNEKV